MEIVAYNQIDDSFDGKWKFWEIIDHYQFPKSKWHQKHNKGKSKFDKDYYIMDAHGMSSLYGKQGSKRVSRSTPTGYHMMNALEFGTMIPSPLPSMQTNMVWVRIGKASIRAFNPRSRRRKSDAICKPSEATFLLTPTCVHVWCPGSLQPATIKRTG